MKYILKLTLTIAIMTLIGGYQLSAQTTKEVKSNNVTVKSSTDEGQKLLLASNKINTSVDSKSVLRKIRVNAIKIYGLVDRNGNPLPTKESVNQLPE